VRLHPAQAVRERAAHLADEAAEHHDPTRPGWWVQIDLDVLRGDEFAACAAASDPAMPGGLSWDELTTICAGPYAARHAEAWAWVSTTATGTQTGGRLSGSCASSADSPTADPNCTWHLFHWPIGQRHGKCWVLRVVLVTFVSAR
jgi:hypothetical protein